MKIYISLFMFFNFFLFQIDSAEYQSNSTLDSIKVHTVIETVKTVFVPQSTNSNDKIFDSWLIITDNAASVLWKALILLVIISLMGYLHYQINKFYNRYNLSIKLKSADFLKLISHLLILLITVFSIIFILLRSYTFLLFLFLIFIFILMIISVAELAKNIMSGVLILIDKPFEHGDWIKIDDYTGKVHSKNLRFTEIITEDDSLVRIPNSLFITNAFENLNVISKNKQVSFTVEVQPKSEISKVKSYLNEIVSLSIYNSINKPVEVIYKGLNSRGNMEFQIKAYVFDAKYENEFKSDVQESIAEFLG